MDSVCACICCGSGVALCWVKRIVCTLDKRSLAVFEDRCLFRAVIGESVNCYIIGGEGSGFNIKCPCKSCCAVKTPSSLDSYCICTGTCNISYFLILRILD